MSEESAQANSGGARRGRGYHGNRGNWRGRWRGRWWRGGGRGQNVRRENGPSPSQNDTGTPPPRKRPHLVQTTLIDCQYTHWNLYFPNEMYTSDIGRKIKEFEKYFSSNLSHYSIEDIDVHKAITVNFTDITQELEQILPDLSTEIKNTPELVLKCLALAFHTVFEDTSVETGEEEDGDTSVRKSPEITHQYNIRLFGVEPMTLLRNVKAPLFGKCISVSGTVVRVSSVKPLVMGMGFQCVLCQEIQSFTFTDGKYSAPTHCPTTDCNSRIFTPLRRSKLTRTIDLQTIRLQEQIDDDRRESGRIPRTIDCELTADLVDSCVPGDVVTVTAVVKATGSRDDDRPRSSKDKCTFLLYLQAISVVNNKSSESGICNGGQEFSNKDYYAIQEIEGDENTFKLLVSSLCPTIYGHEIVKAGLLLGLFGGCQDFTDNDCLSIRGNSHILIVGDPGLGKSQMLQAAANIAPRGVYVCGNTTTTSGLTVTLAKEGGSSEFALEAGALVLGDQGCCCIDEFDKMGSQHQALLEAMEQQCISIAKAGIVCTLPARTSILAAANPVGGHYNKAKTVSENLKMNGALLSRFDLVFILLDKPDEELDSVLSEHVMSLHSRGNRAPLQSVVARRTDKGTIDTSSDQSILFTDSSSSLAEKLKIRRGEELDPIPVQLLRKYIDYARRYVQPRLNSEAAAILQQFYMELRQQRQAGDSTPITTRQLESLIRLTEARARLELRDVANEQDAKDIIEIMKFSMCDTYSDECGFLDFQRSQHGSGMSQKTQAKHFISVLNRQAEQSGKSTFTCSQLKEISQRIGLQVKSFDDFIFSLNNQGYLLKKGPKLFKLQTAVD